LEILMTMAHILDEGQKECRVSHSIWRELNKWFPMILGNCLVFKREPGTSGCAWRHIGSFLEYDHGGRPSTKK
jgi:hypothetical protein